ncbi:hypothetical protein CVT24_010837 [Panaeolus cyanescens]|uniref:CRIB domain-containing protein n=1 Tax=Panaeolus cyanescens TaxID=181874 RepID=A0A409YYK4_9AGAR|nr:hypothetical protein CVT24_010837 [Panaeolus cyanescens]
MSNASSSKVIRSGPANLREKGTFTGVSWKPKRLELDTDYLVIVNPSSNKRLRIPLPSITHLERTDLAPCSLALKSKQKKYNLSFASDKELYDWQDDIYQRCPLGGYSTPFAFEHKSHIGSDAVMGTFTDPNLIPLYAEIIGTTPSMIHTTPTTTAAVVVTPRSRPVSGVPLKAGTAPITTATATKRLSGIATHASTSTTTAATNAATNAATTNAGNTNAATTTTTTPKILEGSFIVKQKGGLFGWRAKNSSISKTLALSMVTRVEADGKRCLEVEYLTSDASNPASSTSNPTSPASNPTAKPTSKSTSNPTAQPTDTLFITFGDVAEMNVWKDAMRNFGVGS